MKIDPDGYRIIGFFIIVAVVCRALSVLTGLMMLTWCSWVFVILIAFSMYFFRDPKRTAPGQPEAAVSAADGVVVDVSVVEAGGFQAGRALRIAVFMNVFNVHVNRSPVDGTVVSTVHRNGKKLSAYNSRAEYENEHGDTDLDTAFGPVRIRQIAGLVARRVVTRVNSGDLLRRGDRIGLIRFGSRVDVFLPETCRPEVVKGERVQAGKTIIARLASSD